MDFAYIRLRMLSMMLWSSIWVPKIVPKLFHNGSKRVSEGSLDCDNDSWRSITVAIPNYHRNAIHSRGKNGPKFNPDGFKIESEGLPNAIWYHMVFPCQFQIEFYWISKHPRQQKPFKTSMTSFKYGLRVCTTSNAISDAFIIDLSSQNSPKIDAKSLP